MRRLRGEKPLIILETGNWYWDKVLELVLFVPTGKFNSTHMVWLRSRNNHALGALKAAVRYMEEQQKEERERQTETGPLPGSDGDARVS